MTTINNYKLWCNDESAYVYVWNNEDPTVCPNVNTHSINVSSISIIENVDENEVIINEEPSNKTGGHFRVVSQAFDAPASVTTTYDFSYPIKMGVLAIEVPTNDNQEGDVMTCVIAPNTNVGAITADVIIGQTVLNVSQTVTDNVDIGYYITITDGTNTDELEQVISIDKANGTITVETATINAFLASTPTYIQVTMCYMHEWEIGRSWVYEFGSSKIGASVADENTIVRIIYKNNTAEQKRVRVTFEVLY